jgi:hypothetical protein
MFKSSKRTNTDAGRGDAGVLRVERLAIRDGHWQQEPANVQIVPTEARRGHDGQGGLYLVIEAPHGVVPPAGLFAELTQLVADTYLSMSRSVTRGLREALLAANALLFERNLRADSAHQVVLGLNCAVLRDNDVYMAQMGPSLITHIHEGQVIRYPTDSIWLRSENPGTLDLSRQPPAGLRREIEPDLWHAVMAPGDVLIVSTTSLARMAMRRELAELTAYVGERSPREAIEVLANGRDLGAVIADWPADRLSDGVAIEVERESRVPSTPHQTVTPPQTTSKAAPTPASQALDEALFARDDDAGEKEDQESFEEEDYADTLSPGGTPRAADEAQQGLGQRTEERKREKGRAQAPRIEARSAVVRNADELRQSISQGASSLRRGAEDVLLNVLPSETPERPEPHAVGTSPTEEAISLSGKALVVVALIIPLVMLALIIMTRIQYERTQTEQFHSLQTLAQAQYDSAIRMAGEAETRRGLEEAMRTVRNGLAIDADDDELQSLQRRIVHKMEEIDRVELLRQPWKLRDLDDAPASPADSRATLSARIVVQGIDVFVLNRSSSRVYQFLLNDAGDALLSAEADSVLVQKGDIRGGITLSDIVDIAWMEAGGDRTLSTFMALERTGFLLAYDPQQGIDVLPVADSEMWLKPAAIGSYFGNLYVLDPLLSRVLRYVPHDNVYTVPPDDYIPAQLGVDLTGAVDMAIDGSVYILFADGQVKKFLRGEPQPFTMQGMPSPMRSPTTIFVSGPKEPDAAGYVYVADAGNERILQFDKAGVYLRQFKMPSGDEQMKELRGLYVDEDRQRLFFLSGRTLWMASLPTLRR